MPCETGPFEEGQYLVPSYSGAMAPDGRALLLNGK